MCTYISKFNVTRQKYITMTLFWVATHSLKISALQNDVHGLKDYLVFDQQNMKFLLGYVSTY